MDYNKLINKITSLNFEIKNDFQKEFNKKMKPFESLGKLEHIGAQIAGIKGTLNYSLKRKKHFVFAGDNGVEIEGVSSCPREFTKLVSETMLSGTAAIAILCDTYNIDFSLVDIGIDGVIDKPYKNFINKKISAGTKNIRYEAAMTTEELNKVFKIVFQLVKKNKNSYDIFSCGEMGIGNTTTSAALIYKILSGDLNLIVGHGSGISNEVFELKKNVISDSSKRVDSHNPMEILRQLGGFDIAAMTAFYLACAYYKIPVILDGYISMAAALVAYKINPLVKEYLIPSHKTTESGVLLVYKYMNLEPALYMNMGLGEGTGAVLMYPLLDGIMPLYKKMLTKKQIYKRFY